MNLIGYTGFIFVPEEMEWSVASWYQNLRIDLIDVCYLDEEVVFFAGTTLNGMI